MTRARSKKIPLFQKESLQNYQIRNKFMKTSILTFEQFHGRKNIGSSRIRAKWVIDNWPEAELYKFGSNPDVLILQKAYWAEFVKAFKGIKILDLCDADWLHWNYKTIETLTECDAVTCSTEAIAEFIRKYTDKPVVVIPDRIDLKNINEQKKEHAETIKTAVWFGYADNYPMIDAAITALKKRGIDLIVISNDTYNTNLKGIKITNYPWNALTVNADIIKADIVLNQKLNTGKWKRIFYLMIGRILICISPKQIIHLTF